MSEANEARETTVAESIIKQLVGNKEDAADNATYRQHIRALIEADFMYIVMVCDGASISLTANAKQGAEWRTFVLEALDKILSKRVTGNDEEAYESKGSGDGKGYL